MLLAGCQPSCQRSVPATSTQQTCLSCHTLHAPLMESLTQSCSLEPLAGLHHEHPTHYNKPLSQSQSLASPLCLCSLRLLCRRALKFGHARCMPLQKTCCWRPGRCVRVCLYMCVRGQEGVCVC